VSQRFSFVTNRCECPSIIPVLDSNGACVACEGYFDITSGQCLDCPIGSNMVKDALTGTCKCPDNYPIFAGGICRVCPTSKYYFDLGSKSCQLCPNGMTIVYNNNTCVCYLSQIYTNGACGCPTDKPYLSPAGCISCVLPKYFNTTAEACLSCPIGY